ncbi:hypothetical protein B566_EDAN006965 [Ephemera danica]|nr:hypothetical protein B566_EDAN006965 [Ephemera danica]
MLPNEKSSPRPSKRENSSRSREQTALVVAPSPLQRTGSGRNRGKVAVTTENNSDSKYIVDNNVGDDAFTPPSPELAARIVQQVEFYFSDVNILKDKFLLQHMKHNKEGFISLKLLSGFKRIKHLVKNWRELAHALENGSEMLQLNNERTKIRRLAPLPSQDESAPYRTIVAYDLPLQKPIMIKSVVNLFSPCGRIILVRILLPKNPIPADIRPYAAGLPDIQRMNEACALVEFSDIESVKYALQRRPACAQAAPLQWGSMQVSPLIQQDFQLNVHFIRTTHRASFHEIDREKPVTPSPAILLTPQLDRRDPAGRRHSCPTIQQYTPIARRRPSVTIPENVIRLPRGPDGTRGFRDRNDLSSSD